MFTGRSIAAAPAASVPAAWSLSAVPENRTRERLSLIGGSPGSGWRVAGPARSMRSRDRSGAPRRRGCPARTGGGRSPRASGRRRRGSAGRPAGSGRTRPSRSASTRPTLRIAARCWETVAWGRSSSSASSWTSRGPLPRRWMIRSRWGLASARRSVVWMRSISSRAFSTGISRAGVGVGGYSLCIYVCLTHLYVVSQTSRFRGTSGSARVAALTLSVVRPTISMKGDP